MGITDSKELPKNDPRFDYGHNGADSSHNGQQQHSKYKDQDDEEDKYAENTQTSGDGDYESSCYRESQIDTPHRERQQRKEVFASMTRRVLHNKENHKNLMNSNRKQPSGRGAMKDQKDKYRNIDPDGIEWVKKEEIIDTKLVSSKPYNTKNSKYKGFTGNSQSRSMLTKPKSGILTFLPPKALATILSYDMGSYRKYMSVCASWHVTIKEAFDQYFNKVENEFVLKYHENLLFTESTTSSSHIKF